MKVAVLGAGAMGSIFGGWLSRHNEVWLIDIWQEHLDAINAVGLQLEANGQIHYFHPRTAATARNVGPVDLVIVFVKSITTATALAHNRELFTPQTLVLTLQNGWGNAADILQYVNAANLLLGTTAHGGNILGPGRVCHAGRGITCIGVYSGVSERARGTADLLTTAGLETTVTDNPTAMIWKKLLVNAAINPLTALLHVRNGYLEESETTAELLENIVREAVTVANAAGMDFDAAAMISHVKEVARLTAPNRSSMLQDVTAKRQTEVERINGAIVTQGRAYGIATPYNKLILQLIKAIEETY